MKLRTFITKLVSLLLSFVAVLLLASACSKGVNAVPTAADAKDALGRIYAHTLKIKTLKKINGEWEGYSNKTRYAMKFEAVGECLYDSSKGIPMGMVEAKKQGKEEYAPVGVCVKGKMKASYPGAWIILQKTDNGWRYGGSVAGEVPFWEPTLVKVKKG